MRTVRVQINKPFYTLYRIPSRYKICYGGRRSGKSFAVSQMLVQRALESRRKILCIRKFGTSVRFSTWPRVKDALESFSVLDKSKVHIGDREITLPNGSQFLFSGIDSPEKLKSAEGVTDVWIEEATEILELDFDTVDAGLSTICTPAPEIWLTFNPIPSIQGVRHWVQRRFIDKVPHELSEIAVEGDIAIMRSVYSDNAFCPESTIRLLNSYKEDNPDLYRLWALGEFVSLHGAILDPEKIHSVGSIPYDARLVGHGLDFGFSNDPAAAVSVYVMDGHLYLRERLVALGLTNPELSDGMEDSGLKKDGDLITADSAEPKSIRELSQMGWSIVGAQKSPDYKRSAANWLRGFHLYITAESTSLLSECATWSWKLDRDSNPLPVVGDGNDHCIDATIYAAYKARGTIQPANLYRARGGSGTLRRSIVNKAVKALGRDYVDTA
jgi:phage terminase large subunit